MGALHRGHSSLVERCRAENEVVVVSIFVNPSQFNDSADLERYPRTLDQDLALLESLGADEVILPSVRGTLSAWLPLPHGAAQQAIWCWKERTGRVSCRE